MATAPHQRARSPKVVARSHVIARRSELGNTLALCRPPASSRPQPNNTHAGTSYSSCGAVLPIKTNMVAANATPKTMQPTPKMTLSLITASSQHQCSEGEYRRDP